MKKFQHLRAQNEVVPLYVLRQQRERKKNQIPQGNIYTVSTIDQSSTRQGIPVNNNPNICI
jgi:hypothetical protein